MNYSLSPVQVKAALAGHDLTTYAGWMAAAAALLADAPDWTAIKDGEMAYIVKITSNGKPYLCAASQYNEPDYVYSLDGELFDFDATGWEKNCWSGTNARDCVRCLLNPVFVHLMHD